MLIKVQKILRLNGELKRELAAVNPTDVHGVERAHLDNWPNSCVVKTGVRDDVLVDERIEQLIDRINEACREEFAQWAPSDEEDDG